MQSLVRWLRIARLRLVSAAGIWIVFLPAPTGAVRVQSQLPVQQQPTTKPQTGPITEPRGAHPEPAGPSVAKGLRAITRADATCSRRIGVRADTLFKPGRWTLEPDAARTLDVLGPLIANTGKHPARIEAFAGTADAGSDQHSLSRQRAITVRGWLINHHFVSLDTPIEGLDQHESNALKGNPPGPRDVPRVEVVIDTCAK